MSAQDPPLASPKPVQASGMYSLVVPLPLSAVHRGLFATIYDRELLLLDNHLSKSSNQRTPTIHRHPAKTGSRKHFLHRWSEATNQLRETQLYPGVLTNATHRSGQPGLLETPPQNRSLPPGLEESASQKSVMRISGLARCGGSVVA